MRIIIEVNGGVVTGVYTNNSSVLDDIAVEILDYDNLKSGGTDKEVNKYKVLEGEKETMYVIY